MVECGREYVLQWPGHAAYVTERFSGLLARQTLVDVTLICDGQKILVHKLVLASCSLYFEELFANDPELDTIMLKDLDFSLLKAMIEFMYCGETTVSHVHLPSLLAAARLFKVKELESLVEKMVGSPLQDHNDNKGEYLPKEGGSGRLNGMISNDDNGIRVSFANKSTSNGQSFDGLESSDSECERNYLDESNSRNMTDSPTNDRCLYDEPCGLVKKNNAAYSAVHRNGEIVKDDVLRKKHALREKSVESLSDTSSTLDSENCEKDSEGTTLYERCCEFVSNGRIKNEEHSQVYLTPDSTDNEINRVGQCSKVYTHKKRKANGENTLKRHTHFEKTLPQPLTSNRIDLADDSSNEEAPITLKTNLDSESSDYLLSFNSESIQSIVGCSLSDFCPSNTFELLNARTALTSGADEKDSNEDEEEEEEEDRPPVLRRSVRLNQQENDESFSSRIKSKHRDRKKNRSPSNMKLFSRTKRKNKDLERRVPNVKVLLTPPSVRKNHSRPLRRTSKHHLTKNGEKDLGKPKSMEKMTVTPEKSEATSATPVATIDGHQTSENATKPSTTASSVNRALWGDMSDVTEDGEMSEEFLEYSTSAEIPFAVGLLPLRAALERMQATLDHQPRKTRSSMASTKQESSNLKRRHSPGQTEVTASSSAKKPNLNDAEVDENPSAVCHIQIRTSPPCSRPRKRSLSDGATSTSFGQTAVNGRP